MRISTRIFLGILFVVAAALGFIAYSGAEKLKPEYRKATEEPLVDFSRLLARIIETQITPEGEIPVLWLRQVLDQSKQQPFEAQIFDFRKTTVDLDIYVTDRRGVVLFSSKQGRHEGEDFSGWQDVRRTLDGLYGARTTRSEEDPSISNLFVSAPITKDGHIIGVLSLSKSAATTNQFILQSQSTLWRGLGALFLLVGVVAFLLGKTITRPIDRLRRYAESVRLGRRTPLPPLAAPELSELGRSLESMRQEVEGKTYVEQYVRALTHELKSPVASIRGAAEILAEHPPTKDHDQFVKNILFETARIENMGEKLLTLSALEKSGAPKEVQPFELSKLVEKLVKEVTPRAEQRGLSFSVRADCAAVLAKDPLLFSIALSNLLENAADFATRGSSIEVSISDNNGVATVLVSNQGDHIPEYALARIFERFYSLPRPDSQRKSSGLGLSIVQEVCSQLGAKVTISNTTQGVEAKITILT